MKLDGLNTFKWMLSKDGSGPDGRSSALLSFLNP